MEHYSRAAASGPRKSHSQTRGEDGNGVKRGGGGGATSPTAAKGKAREEPPAQGRGSSSQALEGANGIADGQQSRADTRSAHPEGPNSAGAGAGSSSSTTNMRRKGSKQQQQQQPSATAPASSAMLQPSASSSSNGSSSASASSSLQHHQAPSLTFPEQSGTHRHGLSEPSARAAGAAAVIAGADTGAGAGSHALSSSVPEEAAAAGAAAAASALGFAVPHQQPPPYHGHQGPSSQPRHALAQSQTQGQAHRQWQPQPHHQNSHYLQSHHASHPFAQQQHAHNGSGPSADQAISSSSSSSSVSGAGPALQPSTTSSYGSAGQQYPQRYPSSPSPSSATSNATASPSGAGQTHPSIRLSRPSETFTRELSNVLSHTFIPSILPTPDEYHVKENARKFLEDLAQRINPGAKLLPFGSQANGMALKNSDMDLCYLSPPGAEIRPAAELVETLGRLIETEAPSFQIKMLPRARIPIIKLNIPPSDQCPEGIACDIGFENRLALENTRLLLTYAMADPRLRSLVLFLKVWCKRRKINNPYLGTLSSYGYVLLAIHYLTNVKNPPVLPNLQRLHPPKAMQMDKAEFEGRDIYFFDDLELLPRYWQSNNRDSIGELLLGFFQYYLKEFKFSFEVVSIRSEGGIVSKSSKGWQQDEAMEEYINAPRNLNRLCIEDPFQTDYNVARTVTIDGLFTIRGEISRASSILRSGPRSDVNAVIADLIEDREDYLIQAPPPATNRRRSAPSPRLQPHVLATDKDFRAWALANGVPHNPSGPGGGAPQSVYSHQVHLAPASHSVPGLMATAPASLSASPEDPSLNGQNAEAMARYTQASQKLSQANLQQQQQQTHQQTQQQILASTLPALLAATQLRNNGNRQHQQQQPPRRYQEHSYRNNFRQSQQGGYQPQPGQHHGQASPTMPNSAQFLHPSAQHHGGGLSRSTNAGSGYSPSSSTSPGSRPQLLDRRSSWDGSEDRDLRQSYRGSSSISEAGANEPGGSLTAPTSPVGNSTSLPNFAGRSGPPDRHGRDQRSSSTSSYARSSSHLGASSGGSASFTGPRARAQRGQPQTYQQQQQHPTNQDGVYSPVAPFSMPGFANGLPSMPLTVQQAQLYLAQQAHAQQQQQQQQHQQQGNGLPSPLQLHLQMQHQQQQQQQRQQHPQMPLSPSMQSQQQQIVAFQIYQQQQAALQQQHHQHQSQFSQAPRHAQGRSASVSTASQAPSEPSSSRLPEMQLPTLQSPVTFASPLTLGAQPLLQQQPFQQPYPYPPLLVQSPPQQQVTSPPQAGARTETPEHPSDAEQILPLKGPIRFGNFDASFYDSEPVELGSLGLYGGIPGEDSPAVAGSPSLIGQTATAAVGIATDSAVPDDLPQLPPARVLSLSSSTHRAGSKFRPQLADIPASPAGKRSVQNSPLAGGAGNAHLRRPSHNRRRSEGDEKALKLEDISFFGKIPVNKDEREREKALAALLKEGGKDFKPPGAPSSIASATPSERGQPAGNAGNIVTAEVEQTSGRTAKPRTASTASSIATNDSAYTPQLSNAMPGSTDSSTSASVPSTTSVSGTSSPTEIVRPDSATFPPLPTLDVQAPTPDPDSERRDAGTPTPSPHPTSQAPKPVAGSPRSPKQKSSPVMQKTTPARKSDMSSPGSGSGGLKIRDAGGSPTRSPKAAKRGMEPSYAALASTGAADS